MRLFLVTRIFHPHPRSARMARWRIVFARWRRRVLDRLAMGLSNQGILDDAVRATAALEAMDPALFDMARVALTYAYYETPAVIEAIRGLGFPYNHAPQPDGYIMRDFDPAIDAPKVPRGHYVATEDVRRVDLTKLDFLYGDRS
jgi:hypothetical protein